MKKIKPIALLTSLCLLQTSTLAGCGSQTANLLPYETEHPGCFSNTEFDITNIGDPFVLRVDEDNYYMYCTSAADGFYCWHSTDMIHWDNMTQCYTRNSRSWGFDSYWAPEVVAYNDWYYMYYTARAANGRLYIGLAVSPNPEGPYLDVEPRPFFDFGYAAIDANVLIDEDGSKYLYYSRDCSENKKDGISTSEIYGVRLTDDMLATEGEPVLLLSPEQDWEMASVSPLWNEGPESIKHNGKYYLTYSGNFYASSEYSIGYAVADNPLGPYVKAEENPILTSAQRSDISGPGHQSFTTSPDGTEVWAVYHSHTDPASPSGNRKVNIDKVSFTEDGRLFINGPTTAKQPAPSGGALENVTSLFVATADDTPLPTLTNGIYTYYNRAMDQEQNVDLSLKKGKASILFTPQSDTGVTNVTTVAIYPGCNDLEQIKTVQLKINNDQLYEVYTVTETDTSPLLFTIPATTVSSLEILLTGAEDADVITLSEVDLFCTTASVQTQNPTVPEPEN